VSEREGERGREFVLGQRVGGRRKKGGGGGERGIVF